MAFAAWWNGDSLPALQPLTGFQAKPTQSIRLMAALADLDTHEVRRRFEQGHQAYVAYWEGVPAAYGWSARVSASIGELHLAFNLPANNRYLWDFKTLPAWRGRGIYPHLLQSIIQQESAERLWIIYAPENAASSAGIRKAGFSPVSELSFLSDQQTAVIPYSERAWAGAHLLGVPIVAAPLSPCWCCVMNAHQNGESALQNTCWQTQTCGCVTV